MVFNFQYMFEHLAVHNDYSMAIWQSGQGCLRIQSESRLHKWVVKIVNRIPVTDA